MPNNISPQRRGNLQKYQSRNPLQKFLITRFLKTVENLLAPVPAGPLLEIGCGEGFVLKHLEEKGQLAGRNFTGMDLSREALSLAASRVPQARLAAASAYTLPFADKSFQAALLLEVLEHLEHPEKALLEAARVSRFAIVSVPHEPWFQAANFLRGKNLRHLGNDPEHIHHWGISSFRSFLESRSVIKAFSAPFPWLAARIEFR